ncbi:PPOX class F420-dependent oxidoreductase [Streptomyces sp. NBC_01477]|uniref:PPOX class F420-dependent oxidoreductase n=1 Tax=Streptomyces sp. NBC_01477 TaxID=2976015 RepID=UPI002E3736F0|nr:PPOX class F420-dependent oxidoreductase [Streptomyces sp. NBC_01477]
MTPLSGSDALAALRRGKYVSVTTYRRDGTGVPTAVWYAVSDRELVFWTGSGSGKVKRIRNGGRVQVAVCNVRGQVTPGAATVEGTARLLDEAGTDAARRLLARKYVLVRLTDLSRKLLRRPRPAQIGVAVTF